MTSTMLKAQELFLSFSVSNCVMITCCCGVGVLQAGVYILHSLWIFQLEGAGGKDSRNWDIKRQD